MRSVEPVPLARLETNWLPPWMLLRLIQHGPRHFKAHEAMDDAHLIGRTGQIFWMIAADGVSTAPFSRYGALLACRAVEDHILPIASHGRMPTKSDLSAAFRAAAVAISREAARQGRQLLDYATTLAAVVVSNHHIIGACLGDSSILLFVTDGDTNKATERLVPFASAPQPAGSGTYTLVTTDWEKALGLDESHSPHVKGVIVATDGAHPFFVDTNSDPHRFSANWMSVLDPLLEAYTGPRFINVMAKHLFDHPAENQDDRTLLIAYRPAPKLAPSFTPPEAL